jgi:hypothetical protein
MNVQELLPQTSNDSPTIPSSVNPWATLHTGRARPHQVIATAVQARTVQVRDILV